MKKIILFTLALIFHTTTQALSGLTEVGGSNLVVADLGRFLNEPDQSDWFQEVKPILGAYHLYKNQIDSAIATACQNGQKKLAVFMWYAPMSTELKNSNPVWFGHIVDSSTYRPHNQVEQNTRNLIRQIKGTQKNNQPCFNEIQFRFAGQGDADPSAWTSWNETQFQQNWIFIYNTRQIVNSETKYSHIKVRYDLGVELGGSSVGQSRAYVQKLWGNYVYTFGAKDTYGFSIAMAHERVTHYFNALAEMGSVPDELALDIYDDADILLQQAQKELQALGYSKHPIIIQETYTSSAETNQQIQTAINAGVNIRTVMQWPNSKEHVYLSNGQNRHFDRVVATDFLYYQHWPTIEKFGYGGPDNKSVWMAGSHLSSGTCQITFFDEHWRQQHTPIQKVPGFQCAEAFIIFRIPDAILNSMNAVNVVVSNELSQWTNPVTLRW